MDCEFHNLKEILTSISFKGVSQLIYLKSLKIEYCRELFSLDVEPEHTGEDMNDVALPSLESLYIRGCGITRKWLSVMLRHSPNLMELDVYECPQLKQLNIEKEGNVQSNLLSAFKASSSGHADETRPSSIVDGFMHVPLNLRKITFQEGGEGSREGFAGVTSLEELKDAQQNGICLLPQSLEHIVWWDYSREIMHPCFMGNLAYLKTLEVFRGSLKYLQLDSCTVLEDLKISECKCLVGIEGMQLLGTLRSLVLLENSRLKSLQLHSCGSLERLEIWYCSSLVALEGLRSLLNLKHLEILRCPVLDSLATLETCESIEEVLSYELFPALESLKIDDLSLLNTSLWKGLTCLRSLKLFYLDATRLTDDQDRALLLRSLQELHCEGRSHLVDLPAGLCGLPSLMMLKIKNCKRISGLPKEGLPLSLEELVVDECSHKLSEGCRLLATSQIEVDGRYVE